MAAAESIGALKMSKVEQSGRAKVTVQLENSSAKPLRIWKDVNSWGAACWRVFRIRNGQLDTFFQNPDQDFTKNGPSFNEIAAGGRFDQKLDLNGGNWCGMGHCSIHSERGLGGSLLTFEPNDTVIVIYDVPVTQEARDNHVWYGVIGATASVAADQSLKADGTDATQSNAKINKTERPVLPVEKSINALKINSAQVSRTAQINVELQNISEGRLRAWKDVNSWGAACWWVLRMRNGQLDTFFQNPDQDFTKNGPSFNEIAAGGRFEQKLDLNGGNWCGLGHCSIYNEHGFGGKALAFEPNDMVIVIFDVPVTQEARDKAVWYGVIAATATVR